MHNNDNLPKSFFLNRQETYSLKRLNDKILPVIVVLKAWSVVQAYESGIAWIVLFHKYFPLAVSSPNNAY